MRTIAVGLIFIFLMMGGTTVWAEELVVTIYFAGTGATADWWDTSVSKFNHTPELLATLHYYQKISGTHPKQFIDGIGTHCNIPFEDLFQKADADLEWCRGWTTCLNEADDFLHRIMRDYSGDVILNLIGWSRGGVLTTRFANRVYVDARIKRINILAIDPAGHRTLDMGTSVPPEEFCLNEKVKQYVGIYATDERSYMFGPAIPGHSAATEVWMARVPGSHETVVGNTQTDGHASVWTPGCGFLWLYDCYDTTLEQVYWVAKAIAVKLLGSSQWGNVEFDDSPSPWDQGLDDEAKKNQFINKADSMWENYDYSDMKKHSFVPIGFEAYGILNGDLGCWWCDFADWLVFKEYEAPRCASLFTCPNEHRNVSLEDHVPELRGEEAWTKLVQLTNLPPAANAGLDRVVSADSTCIAAVTLDGSGSSGNGLQYAWTWAPSGSASGVNPTVSLGPGLHSITLTVSDGIRTSTDTVIITVEDKTPPTIAPPPAVTANIDPGAVSCDKVVGDLTLGTATASDNCSGAISIQRRGVPSNNIFPIGTSIITYTATDGAGNSSTATQKVTVTDSKPPSLKVTLSPNLLWPPDHRMVKVTASIQTSDLCDPNPMVRLVSIVSNEPDNGLGDGDFANDITGAETGADDRVFNLRAERSGTGSGRVYTATYEATDYSGNSSSASAQVIVPHNK